MRQPLSRRALLGFGLLVVTGCRSSPASRPPPAADPDEPALVAARDSELSLIRAYDAAIARARRRDRPALLAQRASHQVHLDALRRLTTGPSPSVVTAQRDINRALGASAARLRAGALTAVDGDTAALLAGIAASHAAAGA